MHSARCVDPTGALVAYGDLHGRGGLLRADSLFRALVGDRIWLLSRGRRMLRPGMKLYFYKTRAGLTGRATIVEIRETPEVPTGIETIRAGARFRYSVVLDDVCEFEPPVLLQRLLPKLELFTGRTEKNWGSRIRQTPVALSSDDQAVIEEAAFESRAPAR